MTPDDRNAAPQPPPPVPPDSDDDARREGWGTLDNQPMRKAHYFEVKGRSLCGRYLALGTPRWESDQGLGGKWSPTSGTCQTCWFKRWAIEQRAKVGSEP